MDQRVTLTEKRNPAVAGDFSQARRHCLPPNPASSSGGVQIVYIVRRFGGQKAFLCLTPCKSAAPSAIEPFPRGRHELLEIVSA
jgi:hypothetical protein